MDRRQMDGSCGKGKFHRQPFSIRSSCHRRAHSEVHFRLPEDLDLVPDPFEGPSGSSFDELGSEDDLFCTYMDIEKLGSRPDETPLASNLTMRFMGRVVAAGVDLERREECPA
ncbi:hypothetical protein GH714_014418 [Hevea brasiliensis]|uniref:Uncharacterized protein n=1 Tax=Hevea brasiliensis TaxID=3981 RepID=A0A6A6N367_HEVBR|nr:hypothetical protein GH714_014418 [Hevea brasiliensis]